MRATEDAELDVGCASFKVLWEGVVAAVVVAVPMVLGVDGEVRVVMLVVDDAEERVGAAPMLTPGSSNEGGRGVMEAAEEEEEEEGTAAASSNTMTEGRSEFKGVEGAVE